MDRALWFCSMADLLIIAPHSDDAEIHCGGTIAAQVRLGRSVALIDATAGELASRGTTTARNAEATAAATVLGVTVRECLGLPDGAVPGDDPAARLLVVDAIRRHRPRSVLCLHGQARHPDHINLARLVQGAIKAASFHRLATASVAPPLSGVRLFFFEAELAATPTFLVPLSDSDWAQKMAAVRCYRSQLVRNGEGDGPATSISAPGFLAWIEARGRAWGHQAGSPYAEAFIAPEPPRLTDLAII
jgi:bacillithiol biosynthesis deacetylase BshB1